MSAHVGPFYTGVTQYPDGHVRWCAGAVDSAEPFITGLRRDVETGKRLALEALRDQLASLRREIDDLDRAIG